MVGNDPGVVGPGREGAEKSAEHHARESEDGGDERTSPASAEVRELRNGLGEKNLVGVALEIAEDRSSEDRGNHDHAEESGKKIVESIGVRGIQHDLAIAAADRAKAFRGHAEKRKHEPEQEIHIRREALEAELQLESEELPKQSHIRFLQWPYARCPRVSSEAGAWTAATG